VSALTEAIAYGLGVEDGTADRERGLPRKTTGEMKILYSRDYIKGYYDGYGDS
jgi:hypothetical protein